MTGQTRRETLAEMIASAILTKAATWEDDMLHPGTGKVVGVPDAAYVAAETVCELLGIRPDGEGSPLMRLARAWSNDAGRTEATCTCGAMSDHEECP